MNALMGANGTGKSTLMRTLAGLHQPLRGRMDFQDLTSVPKAYLPQRAAFDTSIPLRVRDIVAMGVWGRKMRFTRRLHPFDDAVHQALSIVRMLPHADSPLHYLSGGQLQRTLLARVIAQEAQVIFLDEPFNGVDHETIRIILDLMFQWRNQRKTLVVALHQQEIAMHFDHVIALGQGNPLEGAPDLVLNSSAFHNLSCPVAAL